MIESITLRNFQAHKKLTIAFDPHITVVVGDSDAGKSGIIRALSWVMTNTPDGDDFIRHGEKAAIVTLEVDGQVIVRCRGSGENTYNLNGDEFKAFGKAVPERVASLLRVTDINFQRQFDAPFWFCESGGEVSRRLNHVINLGVIDDVLSEVASLVRKNRATVEVCEERTKKARALKEKLFPAVAADAALKEIEEYEAKLGRLTDRCETLRDVIKNVSALEQEVKTLRRATKQGDELLALAKVAVDLRTRYDGLLIKTVAMQLRETLLKMKLPDMALLDGLKKKWEDVRSKRERLAARIEKLRDLWRDRKDAQTDYDRIHKEFHDKTQGMACPVCGGAHK